MVTPGASHVAHSPMGRGECILVRFGAMSVCVIVNPVYVCCFVCLLVFFPLDAGLRRCAAASIQPHTQVNHVMQIGSIPSSTHFLELVYYH